MPTNPYICVGCHPSLDAASITVLNEDLTYSIGKDRFPDWRKAIEEVRPSDCEPDVLKSLGQTSSIFEIALITPYYGPGYERGYWPEIAATLEFVRRRIPNGTVIYGTDTGDIIEVVTDEYIDKMWSYWTSHSDRPYMHKQN